MPTESKRITSAAAAASLPFTLVEGGLYQLAAQATWGGGSLKLSQLMPDGSTFVDLFGEPSNATHDTWVASLTADGVLYYNLPAGSYRLVFATGTLLIACITRVPLQ